MPDADASPAPAQGKKKKKKGAAAESGTAEAEPEGPEQMWAPEQEEGYCLVVPIEEEGADPEDMMQLVQIVGTKGEEGQKTVPKAALFAVNPDDKLGVDDNCALLHLHEPGLLHNLRHRYMTGDRIYTYTAFILIAVNPYKQCPALYAEVEPYRGKAIGVMPPHVYAVGDRAHRLMKSEHHSQTCVISGESGSGKTESAKYIMRYLAHVGRASAASGDEETLDYGALVIQSNPILEATGNAKTLRNNNSSRFGKFIEMHFDAKGVLMGAAIQVYLLEKSRLVHQDEMERNYHIFYQMLAGFTDDELAQFELDRKPETFHYLNQSGCTTIAEMPDDTLFGLFRKACSDMAIDDSAQTAIFQVLSGILHLGNCTFEEDGENGSKIVDKKPMEAVAKLFCVDAEKIEEAMITRTATMGTRDKYKLQLKKEQAMHSRDALSKTMYSRLFDYLVAQINVSLKLDKGSFAFIGVLDIFGFEAFKTNSFEQLCINYTNERLQQYFNSQVLRQEQELYAMEAIFYREVEFADNQDCIDMIEAPPDGILPTLEEEQRMPKASDETFTEKVYQRQQGVSGRLKAPKVSRGSGLSKKTAFIIRHYAGEVTYCTEGFLDKNNDVLNEDLNLLMLTSTHELIQQLCAEPKVEEAEKEKAKKRRSSVGGAKGGTVSGKFTKQLGSLMTTLGKTSSHFIRCIKPNDAQVPMTFTGSKVMSQLRCGGMMEALKLLNAGYPTRCPYQDLYDRYAEMMPQFIRDLSPKEFVEALLMAYEFRRADYQLGLTKVFFRAGKLAFLEELNSRDAGDMAPEIIKKITSWLRRKKLKRAMYTVLAFVKISTRLRLMRAGARFRQAAAVVVVIHMVFFPLAKKIKRKRAAARLEAVIRMKLFRTIREYELRAAFVIQAQVRGRAVRKVYGPILDEKREERREAERLRKEEEARLEAEGKSAAAAAKAAQREAQMAKLREQEEKRDVERQAKKKEAEDKKAADAAQAKELEEMKAELARMKAGGAPAPAAAPAAAAPATPVAAVAAAAPATETTPMPAGAMEAIWQVIDEMQKASADAADKMQLLEKQLAEEKAKREKLEKVVRVLIQQTQAANKGDGESKQSVQPTIAGGAPMHNRDGTRQKMAAGLQDIRNKMARGNSPSRQRPGSIREHPEQSVPRVSQTDASAAVEKTVEDAKTGIMGVFSGVRNIFMKAEPQQPAPATPAKPEQPLTPQEKRVVDLREAVVSIHKYFVDWDKEQTQLSPTAKGRYPGQESRKLHNLVRGRLCTALYLICNDGLRLKNSTRKPHVWQFLTMMANLLAKQMNWEDEEEVEFEFVNVDAKKSPVHEFIRCVRGINDMEVMQGRNDTKYRALIVHGLNTRMLYRWVASVFEADKEALDTFYEEASVMREDMTRGKVNVELEKLKNFQFKMQVEFEIAVGYN